MSTSFLSRLFKSDIAQEVNLHYELRKDSFFIDENYHEHFLKYGWVVVRNVVKEEEIRSFETTFDEISKLEGFEMDKNLLNSGRLFNPEIRKKAQAVSNLNARSILPRMFKVEKLELHTGGAYQVKPAHRESDLLIHQDSTVIDETKDYCLFVWVPFCDITSENGFLSFVSGSHLWGNTQRSLGVPWQFKDHVSTLYKYAEPVLINKGDVVVFDPACIHASAPNLSDKVRPAITLTVLRKNYELVYFYRNKDIDNNLVEKYVVDENFYYNYDFVSKPDETRYKKEVVKFEPFKLSEKELVKLIKKHLPHKQDS